MFFSVWIISLSITTSTFIHNIANSKNAVLFSINNIPLYMPHFKNPLIHQWTFGVFLYLDYSVQCCCKVQISL